MTDSTQQPGGARPGERVREDTIDRLAEAFADDHIPLEEFERRLELAHRAETADELTQLLADLPRPNQSVAPRREAAPAARAPSADRPPPPRRVPERSLVAGILGGGSRSGGWVPARTTVAIGVMGGVSLDLRESPLPTGVTDIECYTLMGGIQIVVPPGVHIDCAGVGFLGGFDYRQREAPLEPDAPVVRITGFAVMGGVEVSVREPGESERDAKRRSRTLKKERRRSLRRRD